MLDLLRFRRERGWEPCDAGTYADAWAQFGGSVATHPQVVERLGYPTRQCLERWLAMDPRYAGRMAKPIIPLETRRKAIELVLGGMQQKQAAKQLGVSVGAVHGWVRAYRKGGMAALQPKNRNSAQGNKPADSRRRPSAADDDDAEALRRRVEELELENALMREVVEVVKKDPGADLNCAPFVGRCLLGYSPRPRGTCSGTPPGSVPSV